MIRLAVVSDLHATTRNSDGNPGQKTFLYVATPGLPAKHDAGHALLELIQKEKLRADALLVPGDLADRASQEGLVWANHVVNEVSSP